MTWVKRCLAPSLVSLGVIAHLRGHHAKAVARIEKAFRWVPQLREMPEYAGYYGLSLLKQGRSEEAQTALRESLEAFDKLAYLDKDEKEIKLELKHEIERALQAIGT